MNNILSELLTTEQVASILAISRDGVYRLIKGKRIKAIKLSSRRIRIKYNDLCKFIAGVK